MEVSGVRNSCACHFREPYRPAAYEIERARVYAQLASKAIESFQI